MNDLNIFRKEFAQKNIGTCDARFLTVVMDISNKCNLRCRMCYFSFDKYFKVKPVYVSPEQFEKIGKVLLPHARTLTISCGNEPLTSPHFTDILRIAHRYNVPHIDFATNGVLLNKKNTDEIIKNGVTEIFLSVDAAEKETYEHIRRGASYHRLIENIRYLQERKKALGRSNPRLRFNITLMKTNIEELENLVIMAHDLGIEKLDFRHLILYDGLEIEDESLNNHKKLANEYLRKAVKKAKELKLTIVAFPGYFQVDGKSPYAEPEIGVRRFKHILESFRASPAYFIQNAFSKVIDGLRSRLFRSRTVPVYCKLPFSYVLLNTGGSVYPCPYCHGEEPYGNVFDGSASFGEVWYGKKYSELRRRIMENDPPEMCRKCPVRGGSTEIQEVFEAREV